MELKLLGGMLRWTIHDIFIHINSFMKNKLNSDFLYRKLHMKSAPDCRKIIQVYMYENVTYGPSQNVDLGVSR